jgi:hypothetical protein
VTLGPPTMSSSRITRVVPEGVPMS